MNQSQKHEVRVELIEQYLVEKGLRLTRLRRKILSTHLLLHGAGELPELGRLAASVLGEEDKLWQADEEYFSDLDHAFSQYE